MNNIEETIKLLEDNGYVLGHPFHIDDIIMCAKTNFNTELTKEEAHEIKDDIKSNFNAEFGINWDVIDNAIADFIQTKENENESKS